MNIEESRLLNDASLTNYLRKSTPNYSVDVAVSWVSAALRFPSLFTNDFNSTAVSSPGRESNADSAYNKRASLLRRRSLTLSSVVSRSKNGRGLLSLLLLTPPAGFAIMVTYLFFDSFTSTFQEKLFRGFKMSTNHQMLYVNSYSMLWIIIGTSNSI